MFFHIGSESLTWDNIVWSSFLTIRTLESTALNFNSLQHLHELLLFTIGCLQRLKSSLSGSPLSQELKKASFNFFSLFERLIRELLCDHTFHNEPKCLLEGYNMLSSVLTELLGIESDEGSATSSIPSWCEALVAFVSDVSLSFIWFKMRVRGSYWEMLSLAL